jgi:hypothetical protein
LGIEKVHTPNPSIYLEIREGFQPQKKSISFSKALIGIMAACCERDIEVGWMKWLWKPMALIVV